MHFWLAKMQWIGLQPRTGVLLATYTSCFQSFFFRHAVQCWLSGRRFLHVLDCSLSDRTLLGLVHHLRLTATATQAVSVFLTVRVERGHMHAQYSGDLHG